MKKLLGFFLVAAFLFSCSDDDSLTYEEQLAKDIEKIEKYLADSNLVAQRTNSGLHYIITQEGNGTFPGTTSVIKVKYVGKFLNGEVFDYNAESAGSFFEMDGGIIAGWKEGMRLFSVGGKGTLFIPSGLAYGTSGTYTISPNKVLIFEIELVNVFNI